MTIFKYKDPLFWANFQEYCPPKNSGKGKYKTGGIKQENEKPIKEFISKELYKKWHKNPINITKQYRAELWDVQSLTMKTKRSSEGDLECSK